MHCHQGTIERIHPHKVDVKIVSASACAACHAKGACSMGDFKEKIIEVPIPDSSGYQVGETVVLEMSVKTGFKAVFFAYFLPFLLLFSTFVTLYILNIHEAVAALASLSVTILYYLILSRYKKYMEKQIVFSIQPKT